MPELTPTEGRYTPEKEDEFVKQFVGSQITAAEYRDDHLMIEINGSWRLIVCPTNEYYWMSRKPS